MSEERTNALERALWLLFSAGRIDLTIGTEVSEVENLNAVIIGFLHGSGSRMGTQPPKTKELWTEKYKYQSE